MRKYCNCCGRQITNNDVSDKYECKTPLTLMCGNNYTCCECSKELDENGLFPEEALQCGIFKEN